MGSYPKYAKIKVTRGSVFKAMLSIHGLTVAFVPSMRFPIVNFDSFELTHKCTESMYVDMLVVARFSIVSYWRRYGQS